MLPPPLDGARGSVAEWCFEPSAHLGGDAFTYAWLDDDHFAIALLDVCGHGVGSALHGMSALHALRSRGLTGVDVTDPAAVATAMNKAFAMEQHHELYLTLWYGVFHRRTRRLRFVSGGHPPAILLTGPSREQARSIELGTDGPTVGVVDDAVYAAQEVALEAFAELFVFSDGTFEIERPTGEACEWSDFVRALREPAPAGCQDPGDSPLRAGGRRPRAARTTSRSSGSRSGSRTDRPDEVTTRTRTIRLTGTDPISAASGPARRLAQTHAIAPAAGGRAAWRWTGVEQRRATRIRRQGPHEIAVVLTLDRRAARGDRGRRALVQPVDCAPPRPGLAARGATGRRCRRAPDPRAHGPCALRASGRPEPAHDGEAAPHVTRPGARRLTAERGVP
jgi:hypothetical protein